MYRFWNPIIKPIFQILQPKTIVEIGSDQGNNTRHLLEYCKQHSAKLHVVDPLPKYDVSAWQAQYGDSVIFHLSLSLNAIFLLEQFDTVLIDGDHNWYTVFNELKLIEKYCTKQSWAFPMIMLHDIGWPYGRRDLYYNPENIPVAYRQSYQQKGTQPGSPELLETGGFNSHLYNAIYENNLKNGVLTAVEDFLKETKQPIDLIKIPGFHGLGILFPLKLKEQNSRLAEFITALSLPLVVEQFINHVEKARVEVEIAQQEYQAQIRQLKTNHKNEIDCYQQQIAALQRQMAEAELKREVHSISDKVRYPNFLIIGAQKAGTTWLYKILRQHPEVYMPGKKELEFFSYQSKIQAIGLRSYLKYFNAEEINTKSCVAIGEATPSYFWNSNDYECWCFKPTDFNENIPQSIYYLLGSEIKLILSLRNPVYRAISAYFHQIKRGRINLKQNILEVGSINGIIHMGFYHGHLKKWLEYFNKKKFQVIIYELDIKSRKNETIQNLYNFLKIDNSFIPKQFKDVVNKGIERKIYQDGVYVKISDLEGKALGSYSEYVKVISREDIEELKNIYRKDIKNLETLLNRDLSFWFEV